MKIKHKEDLSKMIAILIYKCTRHISHKLKTSFVFRLISAIILYISIHKPFKTQQNSLIIFDYVQFDSNQSKAKQSKPNKNPKFNLYIAM